MPRHGQLTSHHIYKPPRSKTDPADAMASRGGVELVGGDLFMTTNSIVHCVSKDCWLKKGVAGEIRRRFGGIAALRAQNCEVGQVGVTSIQNGPRGEPRYIFHVFTKHHYWQKPRLHDLEVAIRSLKLMLWSMNISEVSAPWLGTGLDKLPKGRVWSLLSRVFNDSGILFKIHELELA